MNPLTLSSFTLTSGLGTGLRAHVDALLGQRSGLAPCTFESARLDTWVGQVPDEHLAPVQRTLAAFDCRNNRLAQLALAQDGFDAGRGAGTAALRRASHRAVPGNQHVRNSADRNRLPATRR